MATKIQKWGNGQGLRLTKQVLEDAHISVGDHCKTIGVWPTQLTEITPEML